MKSTIIENTLVFYDVFDYGDKIKVIAKAPDRNKRIANWYRRGNESTGIYNTLERMSLELKDGENKPIKKMRSRESC